MALGIACHSQGACQQSKMSLWVRKLMLNFVTQFFALEAKQHNLLVHSCRIYLLSYLASMSFPPRRSRPLIEIHSRSVFIIFHCLKMTMQLNTVLGMS